MFCEGKFHEVRSKKAKQVLNSMVPFITLIEREKLLDAVEAHMKMSNQDHTRKTKKLCSDIEAILNNKQ